MHVNSTRSKEMGRHFLSRTPQLSKILSMPTASQPEFVKPPDHGLSSWDGLMHFPGSKHKWNITDITDKNLCKRRYCENPNTLRNGLQPSQFLHASSPWTSSILLPGHTDMTIQSLSNTKEYQMQVKKCQGN